MVGKEMEMIIFGSHVTASPVDLSAQPRGHLTYLIIQPCIEFPAGLRSYFGVDDDDCFVPERETDKKLCIKMRNIGLPKL